MIRDSKQQKGKTKIPYIAKDFFASNYGLMKAILKFYNESNCGGDQVEVDWEVVEGSEKVSPELPDDGKKSLFPTKPEIIFADNPQQGEANQLQFQTVHTGEFKLKITPKNQTSNPPKSVELLLKINKPTRLGTTFNNYDNEIINYAHKYGIPPQYVKGQVDIEAKKKKNINGQWQYIADSFRYEPVSWDISNVSKWTENDWVKNGSDMWAFKYPLGYNLEGVWDKINQYCYGIITIPQDPTALPVYTCTPYSDYPEDNLDSDPSNPKPVRVADVYNFNNGWAEGSYPQILYGRPTTCPNPCVPRQGWDKSMAGQHPLAYHNYQYYCGASTVPDADCCENQEAVISWLINPQNFDVYAQIPVCSSYGLMQVMYFTAIKHDWRCDSDPSLRKPEELLDVNINLDVGVGFDSKNLKKKTEIENSHSRDSYNASLKKGFKLYNPHKIFDDGKTYGEEVEKLAKKFMPQS